jgi:hypothetical protein
MNINSSIFPSVNGKESKLKAILDNEKYDIFKKIIYEENLQILKEKSITYGYDFLNDENTSNHLN